LISRTHFHQLSFIGLQVEYWTPSSQFRRSFTSNSEQDANLLCAWVNST